MSIFMEQCVQLYGFKLHRDKNLRNIVKEKMLYKEEDMEEFYNALKQAKKFQVDISTKRDVKRFSSILLDLAPNYVPECNWLKRIIEREIHLEFINKKNVKPSEKKQLIGRISQQLEDEEGFNQKVIKKMIISLMILGEWQETYDEIINGEKRLQGRKNSTYRHEKSFPIKNTRETSDAASKILRVSAPVSGKILRVNSQVGTVMQKGDCVIVIQMSGTEAEVEIIAPQDGKIKKIVKEGETVYRGDTIAIITDSKSSSNSKNDLKSSGLNDSSWLNTKKQTVDNMTSAGGKIERVSAPVLGKISQVNVKLGTFVSKGDTIMAIKAGTTELKIVAPESGRIASIAIRGKTVYRGDTIAIINSLE